jgi:hypothetical protein
MGNKVCLWRRSRLQHPANAELQRHSSSSLTTAKANTSEATVARSPLIISGDSQRCRQAGRQRSGIMLVSA